MRSFWRKSYRYRKAFTLLEVLVVLAIMGIISLVGLLSLTGTRGGKDLQNSKNTIGALLREAQSRSISQSQSAAWGVHFGNATSDPFYALFYGTYSTSTRIGVYALPPDVSYDSASVPSGGTLEITFEQITGIPSTSTTIILDEGSRTSGAVTATSSVTISASGLITF